jgi:glycosyltransferase involved in cell wall biosynthesis
MNNSTLPLVSVIVPVYNHEKFIGETIKGVISQTFQNWELLIVDDCSTDKSWEIIQEYIKKDSRIKAFRNETNRGLIPNWKFLIENSSGDYLAFLEGDDLFYHDNLEKKINVFKRFSDLGMVYCNFNVIDKDGSVLIGDYRSFQKIKVFRNQPISPSAYLSSKYHLINSYGQIMVKRSVVEMVGYPRTLDPSAKVFLPSDWDFNFRISTKNNIYYVEDVLFGYRRHANNNSYDAVKAYAHISLLLNEYEKVFSDNHAILKAIRYKRGRYIYTKIIYFLETKNKPMAWREFFAYVNSLQILSVVDIDLNIKLLIRMFLPDSLNLYIKTLYYHQD